MTEVRGFLGLARYYRRFINQFANLATPLTGLTKNTPELHLTPQCESAFEQIKDAMVRAPVLVIPDTYPYARYTLYTDAFKFAVGTMLLQDQGIGLDYVAYHARKMKRHEVHYHVHEQDLMPVRDALPSSVATWMARRDSMYLRITTRCNTCFGYAICLLDRSDGYKF
jgi:hypothetical protein